MGVIKATNNLLLPGRRRNRSLSTWHKAISVRLPASAVGRRLLFFSLRVFVTMVALVQLMVDVGVRGVPQPPPKPKEKVVSCHCLSAQNKTNNLQPSKGNRVTN